MGSGCSSTGNKSVTDSPLETAGTSVTMPGELGTKAFGDAPLGSTTTSRIHYRLRYLTARGRAEVTRLMFNIGKSENPNISWEDKRYSIEFVWQKDEEGNIDNSKWPTIVRDEFDHTLASGGLDTGMGMVPILDVICEQVGRNGEVVSKTEKSIGQSMAIERYVARICGLMGDVAQDEFGIEAAQIEQVAETVRDLANSYNSCRKLDEEQQKKWFVETLPGKLKLLEKSLPPCAGGSPWLASSKMSYADVSLFALLCMKAGVKEWDPFLNNAEGCRQALEVVASQGMEGAKDRHCPRILRALEAVGELNVVKKHMSDQPESER